MDVISVFARARKESGCVREVRPPGALASLKTCGWLMPPQAGTAGSSAVPDGSHGGVSIGGAYSRRRDTFTGHL